VEQVNHEICSKYGLWLIVWALVCWRELLMSQLATGNVGV